MNRAILHAKNETVEFLLADALLVFGGILIGTFATAPPWQLVLGTILLIAGLFLGLRVLRSFSSGLSKASGMIEAAAADLKAADQRNKKSSQLLRTQRAEIEELTLNLRETKDEFENARYEIEEEFEKVHASLKRIFGNSETFSRFDRANTLEEKIEELEYIIEEMRKKVDKNNQ